MTDINFNKTIITDETIETAPNIIIEIFNFLAANLPFMLSVFLYVGCILLLIAICMIIKGLTND